MARKRYSKEFKVLAVKQIIDDNKKIINVAKELDINASMLSRWVIEYDEKSEDAFRGHGKVSMLEFENKKLKKKIEELELQLEIKDKFNIYAKKKD